VTRVVRHRGRWMTQNAVPGVRVYGERLVRQRGKEYRAWSPRRSKLAAYLANRGKAFRPNGAEHWLYLGAASGTTVSHVSDALPDGRVVAVEFSPRPYGDLLELAARRRNVLPVLSDASEPDAYAMLLEGPVDVVYQDIAQRDQDRLFLLNAKRFLKRDGTAFLAVKARSMDVAAAPRDIFKRVAQRLRDDGLAVDELVDLGPWQADHAMLVARWA